jgi:hypothetical protein
MEAKLFEQSFGNSSSKLCIDSSGYLLCAVPKVVNADNMLQYSDYVNFQYMILLKFIALMS